MASKAPSAASLPPPTPLTATATDQAAARTASKEWNDYVNRYAPLEGQYRDAVAGLNHQGHYDMAAGRAHAQDMAQFADARPKADPTQGAGFAEAMRTRLAGVGRAGKGVGDAYLNTRGRFLDAGLGVVNMGRGIADSNIGALNTLAGMNAQNALRAGDANMRNNSRAIQDRLDRNARYADILGAGLYTLGTNRASLGGQSYFDYWLNGSRQDQALAAQGAGLDGNWID